MEAVSKLFEINPMVGALALVILTLSGYIVRLLKRINELHAQLQAAIEKSSEKYIDLLTSTNTQLTVGVSARRDADDRYNQVLAGIISAIKENNPNGSIQELADELKNVSGRLEAILRNQIIIGQGAGIPIDQLLRVS